MCVHSRDCVEKVASSAAQGMAVHHHRYVSGERSEVMWVEKFAIDRGETMGNRRSREGALGKCVVGVEGDSRGYAYLRPNLLHTQKFVKVH